MTTTATPGLEDAVRERLAGVADPELPMVGLVDLGMILAVRITPDGIRVEVLPTFIGCPAQTLIADAIRDGLDGFGREVEVETSFEVPWTTDRVTPAGREALRRAGIAPPGPAGDVACPWCESGQVVMDNLFGPTQCRSLYYCRACRQPFEAMRPV